MNPVITVTGLDETMQMLREAPKTVVATGLTKALSAAGNVIAAELELRAPVKPIEETGGILEYPGEMREQIMVAVELDSQLRGGSVNVGWPRGSAADLVAGFVEWGHRIVVPGGFYTDSHGRRRKGSHIGDVEEHPFVRPAAATSAEPAIDAFAESLRQTLSTTFPQGNVA